MGLCSALAENKLHQHNLFALGTLNAPNMTGPYSILASQIDTPPSASSAGYFPGANQGEFGTRYGRVGREGQKEADKFSDVKRDAHPAAPSRTCYPMPGLLPSKTTTARGVTTLLMFTKLGWKHDVSLNDMG